MGIDHTLYEAATVDGANRFHKVIHITIPGIIPTIVILLILSLGGLLDSNTEKILLMINPAITDRYEISDRKNTCFRDSQLETSNDSFTGYRL